MSSKQVVALNNPMENINQENTKLDIAPQELRVALAYYQQNGDSDRIASWIRGNGIQTKNFDLGEGDLKTLNSILYKQFSLMQNRPERRNIAIQDFGLLVKAGLLNKETLSTKLKSYIDEIMGKEWDEDSVSEYREEIKNKVFKELGLNLSI